MNTRRLLFIWLIIPLLGVMLPIYAQQAFLAPTGSTGDRVTCNTTSLEEWIPAALSRDSYHIGPGDTLNIHVQGKADLGYQARPDAASGENPNEATVTPSGDIYLPLAGKIAVSGKTISEAEELVRSGLSKYIRQFDLSVTVSKVRTVNVWIGGEVENPGPQILPAVSTVSLAALKAVIKPSGSTRCITLIRGDTRRTVDLYKMTITGDVSGDIPLEPGDSIHVPAVTKFVNISGEVTRPGCYEMIGMDGGKGLTARDLIALANGAPPSAALDKAFIDRIGEDGKKEAVNINLRDSGADSVLQSGDDLIIPSISSFQPMIRMVGEFKGEGVYQRVSGTTEESVQNKSGIYFLRKGQTVLDVITITGGVTPQADLKHARIERHENGSTTVIPVDLERLMLHNDKSADVALVNGDSLVLPAVADRVHVFGEIHNPGSCQYSPNRRLIDYLGDAGGPTPKAKLTEISVVRGNEGDPKVIKLNAKDAIRGSSIKGNPVLEPGDIVYVPSKFIAGWQDAVQLVFTGLSLQSLINRL